MQETGRLFSCCPSVLYKNGEKRNSIKCTLGAFLHLLLRPIFRQLHPNFINVRTAYASEIWAQLTKNHLTKSSTERFREYVRTRMEEIKMAKDKKMVEAITSMEEDFAQWYTDVVKKAELCDYTSVKGCMVIKPAGYAIWELIQKELDARFKAVGVQNVYLPMFIPESLLDKEKDHVEGFAPEVAWVTQGGLNELPERLCVRPTSETLFCDFYKNDIHSYRDLPKVYNQWCSVVRWEKETRPFLRSREFLWQEGHTIHATYEEAEERTKQMWRVYRDFAQDVLAIPVVSGRKTESEKFAGAQDTYTIEALMHDGKALQSATSHFFGSSFPSAFLLKYWEPQMRHTTSVPLKRDDY